MNYSLYGRAWQRGITHAALLAHAREHRDLMARAEDSGSEGCYVEVARWNFKADRWERYCFEKFFGGEHPSDPSRPENGDHPHCLSCYETAERFAAEINDAANGGNHALIHHMPDWESEP